MRRQAVSGEFRSNLHRGGKAKAVLPGGGQPRGTFTVKISNSPQQAFVNDKGQIVKTQ